MARSDTEEYCQPSGVMGLTNMVEVMEDKQHPDILNDTTIHSGHFMVSCVHDREQDEDETSEASDIAARPVEVHDRGFDFQNATHEPQQSYHFGTNTFNRYKYAIDSSLSTLFECMTLAYSGKLTSPKWKNFKGIKLRLKEKIRLNNIIWREWHMQFIHGQKPIVCHFDPPISDKTHAKPEAVVLEGKYWKRRLESVTSEYKKWRLFFKHQAQGSELRDEGGLETKSLERLLQQVAESYSQRAPWQLASTRLTSSRLDPLQTDDDDLMDFSDTLFTTLNQQNFTFPSPREMSGLGNADIMQPGLVQLQPNFDDFMDTIDVADMLSSTRPDPVVSNVFALPTSSAVNSTFTTSSLLPTSPDTMPLDESVDLNSAISSGLFGDTGSILDVQQPALPAMSESVLLARSPTSMSTPVAAVSPLPAAEPTAERASARATTQNLNYQTSQIIRLILQQHQQAPFQFGQTENTLQQPHLQQPLAQSAHLQQPQLQSHTPLQQPQLQHAHLQATQLQKANLQQTQIQQAQLQQTQLQQTQLQQTQLQQTQLQQAQLQQAQLQQTQLQQTQLQQAQLQQAQLQQIPLQTQSLLGKSPAVQLGSVAPVVGAVQSTVVQPTLVTAPQTVTIIQNTSQLHSLLQSLNSQVPAAGVGETYHQPGVKPEVHSDNMDSAKDGSRRASTGSMNNLRANSKLRREGDFLVPQKPVTLRSKQRSLAPAPPAAKAASSPIVQQNTFLAQLLTGRYPSAAPASVKREDQPKPAVSPGFLPIQPAAVSPPAPQPAFPISTVAMSDLKKNVLIAPAGQAPAPVNEPLTPFSPSSPSQHAGSAPGSPASPGASFSASSPSYSVPSPGSDSANSPGKPPYRVKPDGDRVVYRENRRVSHITAEQKRRYNIKEGFDTLHQLVPALKSNPNSKISKAATLSKTAEFCRKLKEERAARQQQTELLRQEIESLNSAISLCQQQLPATGAPVTRQRADQMREMFADYVRRRTLENWKFWIFSIIIRPLFESYNNMVSTVSVEDLCRTVLAWLEQHCSLVALRPGVLNSLCHLSTTTSILSDPDRVADQATQAVLKKTHTTDLS